MNFYIITFQPYTHFQVCDNNTNTVMQCIVNIYFPIPVIEHFPSITRERDAPDDKIVLIAKRSE